MVQQYFFRLNYGNDANQNMFVNMLDTYANWWLRIGGVTIPTEGSNGDNFCFPCISYKKNGSMVKNKQTFILPLLR